VDGDDAGVHDGFAFAGGAVSAVAVNAVGSERDIDAKIGQAGDHADRAGMLEQVNGFDTGKRYQPSIQKRMRGGRSAKDEARSSLRLPLAGRPPHGVGLPRRMCSAETK